MGIFDIFKRDKKTEVDPFLAQQLRERGKVKELVSLQNAERNILEEDRVVRAKRAGTPVRFLSEELGYVDPTEPEQKIFEIPIGEGLSEEGIKLKPFVYKDTAEALKLPEVRKQLREGNVRFTNDELQLSPKARAEQVVKEQIEKPYIKLKEQDKFAQLVTAPIRFTAGSLARLTLELAFESAGVEDTFVPITRTQQLLYGDEPISKLSKSESLEGLTNAITVNKLQDLGFSKELSEKAGFGGALLLGAFLENPFIAGAGKPLKEGAEKVLKKELTERIIKQTGEELSENAIKVLDDKIVKIVKITDPEKRAEEAVKAISEITGGLDPIKVLETEKEALERAAKSSDNILKAGSTNNSKVLLDQRDQVQKVQQALKEGSDLSSITTKSLRENQTISQARLPLDTPDRLLREASYRKSITEMPQSVNDAKYLFASFEESKPQLFLPLPNEDTTKLANDLLNIDTNLVENAKDIGILTGQFRDVYRNFDVVFGKNSAVKKTILEPFDEAKGLFTQEVKEILEELDEKIIKGFGIKKKSPLSKAIQEFGEKRRTYNSLVSEFGEKKANQVVEADKWFRQKYDEFLDDVNEVRAKIYPNQSDKLVPKRQDYYRHFRDLTEGMEGLKNLFETPSGIAPELVGISEITKPRTKWLSFAQRRLGRDTTYDAVSGFLDYLPAYAYAKHIDPQIGRFRTLRKQLVNALNESNNPKKLNNFLQFINSYANNLAGTTKGSIDRIVTTFLGEQDGRTVLRALNWGNKRVKSNLITGNAAAGVSQIFNVPQGIASAGIYNSMKGIGDSLAGVLTKGLPIEKSKFIAERYLDSSFDKFAVGMLDNTKKFAKWVTSVMDEVGTKFIWNAHYRKALTEGISNPIKYADELTRSLVAGRGIGELPLIHKSKLFQIVAPFQLEVGNLWWVMKDFVDPKKPLKTTSRMMTLFTSLYLFNNASEKISGRRIVFDPIDAMLDAMFVYDAAPDKKTGLYEATGRLVGEGISNVPLGQTISLLLSEDNRRRFFGEADPTRFGVAPPLVKAIREPNKLLTSIILPFGGKQVEKTWKGVNAMFSEAIEDKSGHKMYEVEKNIPNILRLGLFGAFSTPEAKQFFDREEVSEKMFNELKGMQPSEANAILDDLETKIPALYKKIEQKIIDEQNGITQDDRLIRNLDIKNGARAGAIWERLKDIETKEQKNAYLDDLEEKGIINKKVNKQLDELIKGETQLKGKNIVDPKSVKIDKIPKDAIIFRLPEFLGGGEFATMPDGTPVEVKRKLSTTRKNVIRGGTFDETDKEVDHIISLSLGGTNSNLNLDAKSSKPSIIQKYLIKNEAVKKAYEAITGKEINENQWRQEGKVRIEQIAIDKYNNGEISLAEARLAIINWNNRPEVFLGIEENQSTWDWIKSGFLNLN